MVQSQRSQSDAAQPATDPNPDAGAGATGAILNAAQLRWVKVSIIVMTAMFAVGIPLLIGRIIYLARSNGAAATAVAAPAKLAEAARLALPAGAAVRSLSLSGSLLAVHFTTPGSGDGIVVLDLVSGVVQSRIAIGN